jgi:hypothetical protein
MLSIDRSPQWVGRGQELAVLGAGVEALSAACGFAPSAVVLIITRVL